MPGCIRSRPVYTTVPLETAVPVLCKAMKVSLVSMRSRHNRKDLTKTRKILMFIASRQVKTDLRSIGRYFGGRTHRTVIYAEQMLHQRYCKDEKFRNRIDKLESKLKPFQMLP